MATTPISTAIDPSKAINWANTNFKLVDTELAKLASTDNAINSALYAETERALDEEASLLGRIYDEQSERISADNELDDRTYSLESFANKTKPLIPNQASSSNQLADKDYVNSAINNMTASRVSYNAAGQGFPTQSALTSATVFYHGGAVWTPTAHDYATVLADSSAPAPFTGGQTEWEFDGTKWAYVKGINERPFTSEETATIGSGITAALTDKLKNPDTKPTSGSAGLVTSGGVFSWFGKAVSSLSTTAKTVVDAINELAAGKLGKTEKAADSALLNSKADTAFATAAQGAKADSALQTETDPIYTADKANIATKAYSDAAVTVEKTRATQAEAAEAAARAAADALLLPSVNADVDVMTNPIVHSRSATSFNLTKPLKNLKTGSTSSSGLLSLPMATETLAGIMPAASFKAVEDNTAAIAAETTARQNADNVL